MAKKVVIWSFRLRMISRSRLILDTLPNINESWGKFGIPSDQIRVSMRALARKMGLEQTLSCLFGPERLWFGNARAQDAVRMVSVVRMPVDAKTGVSTGRTTVLPAFEQGAEFDLDIGFSVAQKDEGRVMGAFAALLGKMQESGIRTGRLQTRGYGRLLLDGLRRGRYPMWTRKGATAFLLKEMTGSNNPRELLSDGVKEFSMPEDTGEKIVKFGLELRPTQGVVMPKHVDGYLPGTLMAGVLRRHAMDVLGIMRVEHAQEFVDRMFGVAGTASRLLVDDVAIQEGETMTRSRVGLDDFTGGIIGDRAYRRTVVIRPVLRCNIELTGASDAEIGLLVLVLRDMAFGRLALGAGGAIGFGLCKGIVRIKRGKNEWSIGEQATKDEDLVALNGFAAALIGQAV